jgi:hypothetical protein
LRRQLSAIIQQRDSWQGIRFELDGTEISGLELHEGKTLAELEDIFGDAPYSISINSLSGYLTHLKFPFGGKRRIALVIKGELGSLLPFEAEEMVTDFQELGKGNVLAASVDRTDTQAIRTSRMLGLTTMNNLSALAALRWFVKPKEEGYTLFCLDREAATIMAFRAGVLCHLRQFYYAAGQDTAFAALKEVYEDRDLSQAPCYVVDLEGSGEILRETIGKNLGIKTEAPRLKDYLKTDPCPDWLWAGIGAALLGLSPKNEINLTTQARQVSLPLEGKPFLIAAGCAAAISLIVLGMFSLNYTLKDRAYRYLNTEQLRIYRTAFPKAPPIKDVAKAFEDRLRLVDRDLSGTGINVVNSPLHVLAELSGRIEDNIDVKVHEFSCDDKEFSISGTTISFAAVEKIKSALEQAREFRGVEIQTVDLSSAKQVKFKIRGKL